MAVLKREILIFCLTVLCACHVSTDKRYTTPIARYKDTPAFIKSFLNSKHNGAFLVAEPGEEWSSGCVGWAGVPRLQFKRALIDSTEYWMEFWEGGIAGPHLDTMVLGLNNNKVVSFTIGSYYYKIE